MPLGLSAEAFGHLVKEDGKRYIYGSIRYEDVFDRPHIANFCLQMLTGGGLARIVPCNYFDHFD